MSKTFFNISEQKTNVINFIKKHKNIICLDSGSLGGCKAITDEFIGELVKSNNEEFFCLAQKVRLKFGQNFFVFSDNRDEKHHMIQLWLPTIFSHVASDKAITQFCSRNSFDDVIATRCSWFNMTPKRWETFEAIFDFYVKPKTSYKKTTKKTTKKTSTKVVGMALNDFKRFLNDIVFID